MTRGDRSSPALVILAAGESARLGCCKALAPITPKNPLELLCAAAACLEASPPLIVTGADHDEIAASAPPGVEILFNPDWKTGRTGGVLLASRRRPGFDLCIAPVDVPLVPRSVFEVLLAEWGAAGCPARGWLAPWTAAPTVVGRAYGHPVIVGRDLLGELGRMGPDAPLGGLRERAEPLLSAEVASPAILDDLDTPEDLRRLRARSRG